MVAMTAAAAAKRKPIPMVRMPRAPTIPKSATTPISRPRATRTSRTSTDQKARTVGIAIRRAQGATSASELLPSPTITASIPKPSKAVNAAQGRSVSSACSATTVESTQLRFDELMASGPESRRLALFL